MGRRSRAPRADVAQLVERRLPKPKVAGSRPVVRFHRSACKRTPPMPRGPRRSLSVTPNRRPNVLRTSWHKAIYAGCAGVLLARRGDFGSVVTAEKQGLVLTWGGRHSRWPYRPFFLRCRWRL